MKRLKKNNIKYNIELEKIINQNYFYIIDKNIFDIYKKFKNLNKYYIFNASEKNKSINTIEEILTLMQKLNIKRTDTLCVIGGGITCDVGGFVSSIYNRGINLILIPTTLLAQVDASVGGKNGINYHNFKNQIGSFKIPNQTIINTFFLETLPEEHIFYGLIECLKHGLINNSKYFYQVLNLLFSQNYEISQFDEIIRKSIKIKMKYVKNDICDHDKRNILNFGHTIGHGIEKSLNYPHGKAILYGIIIESYISFKYGVLNMKDYTIIMKSLEKITTKKTLHTILENKDIIIKAIKYDKKNSDTSINFPFIIKIGKTKIKKISLDIIKGIFNDMSLL